MSEVTITRRLGIDCGHALRDHLGQCHRPHGHRYEVEVEVGGDISTGGSERGMVMDLAFIKEAMRDVLGKYDHRFMIESRDPRGIPMSDVFNDPDDQPVPGWGFVILTEFPPTAEMLARVWGSLIDTEVRERSDGRCSVVSCTVHETPNGRATWRA